MNLLAFWNVSRKSSSVVAFVHYFVRYFYSPIVWLSKSALESVEFFRATETDANVTNGELY